MGEEVTRLALECLKIDLERLRLEEEANKLMMEVLKDLIPVIPQVIAVLVESEGKFSPEMFKELSKRMPGFVVKLSISDFIKFASTTSDESLKSLIADLQKMLDDRGNVDV